jgi:hypothetical protein
MIFTVIGSLIGGGAMYWFVSAYNKEQRPYSNEELQIMSQRIIEENKRLHRNTKTVVTIDELRLIDPLFTPPLIPQTGEPDI